MFRNVRANVKLKDVLQTENVVDEEICMKLRSQI